MKTRNGQAATAFENYLTRTALIADMGFKICPVPRSQLQRWR